MFVQSAPVEGLTKQGKAVVVVGVGGIGFNIVQLLIQDGYPLSDIYAIDGDKTDNETLYKYGYSPAIKTNVPKVAILRDMARRRYKIDVDMEGDDDVTKIAKLSKFEEKYATHYIPLRLQGDMDLAELLNYKGSLILINTTDNSAATKAIKATIDKHRSDYGRNAVDYFKISFDGNTISATTEEETWSEYSGYSIGSSNYLSMKAAFYGIEYIVSVLKAKSENEDFPKVFSLNMKFYDKFLDVVKESEAISEEIVGLYANLATAYRDAVNEYREIRKDELKYFDDNSRTLYSYLVSSAPYYKSIEKTLKNGILFKGYYKAHNETAARDKYIRNMIANTPTWKFSYKSSKVVLPLLRDTSMVSLLPPVEIPGIPNEYMLDLYRRALVEIHSVKIPYLYDFLDMVARDALDIKLLQNTFDSYKLREYYKDEDDMTDEQLTVFRTIKYISGILSENPDRLILLLAYLKFSNKDKYLEAVRGLKHNNVIRKDMEDDIFEYYFRSINALDVRNIHPKSWTFNISTSAGAMLSNKYSIRPSLNGDFWLPYMKYTISANFNNIRLMDAGGMQVAQRAGQREVEIPNSSVLETDMLPYFYGNKFTSTNLNSLYQLMDIAAIVRAAIILAKELKEKKDEKKKDK